MKLVYVFDAYCGWSHGFSGTLREVIARHPDLPVDVVSGGLFTGPRRAPIRTFGYVQGANAVVTAFESAEPQADFSRAAELGVTGFPTLLAINGRTVTVLARGHATADDVEHRLTATSHTP